MKADVVVLGAGIIGAATARELSRTGVDVMLVEAGEVGTGASGRCDGNLFVQAKHDVLGVEMTRYSIHRYREWAAELDLDIHFVQDGSLFICTDEAGEQGARERAAWLASCGVQAQFMESAGIHDLEPGLGGDAIAGIHCAEDAAVYPPAVVAALVHDARRHGCVLATGTRARRIVASPTGTVEGVETDRGVITAPYVVNALGAWAAELAGDDGLDIPVMPRQGILAVTDVAPGLVNRPVSETVYLDTRTSAGQGTTAGIALVAEPTFRGNVLIGSTRRFCGFDTSVDLGLLSSMVRRATSLLPSLAGIQIIRAFAGLRPWTPDNRPIIGRSRTLDGYLLATGHEGEGIGLAPVTAHVISKLVTGTSRSQLVDDVLAACDPHRFTSLRRAEAS